MFIGNSLQTIGLQYTTAGKQSFITSMYIILIPLMTWAVSRKRLENSILVAAVIGFTGIACITLTDEFTVGKGDIMTFALALTFSAQVIFIAAIVKGYGRHASYFCSADLGWHIILGCRAHI